MRGGKHGCVASMGAWCRIRKAGHAAYLETVPLRTVAAFTSLQALLLLVVYVRAHSCLCSRGSPCMRSPLQGCAGASQGHAGAACTVVFSAVCTLPFCIPLERSCAVGA